MLRRGSLTRRIPEEQASLAYGDLVALSVEFYPFERFSDRVWELRHTVTAYDAWYVALAESLDLALATLDRKLTRAQGPRCEFVTPAR